MVGKYNSNYRIYVWGRRVTHCPTWSTSYGQDDIQWYGTNYWDAFGGVYWCEAANGNHPNKDGTMATHFYNDGTAVYGWNGWVW